MPRNAAAPLGAEIVSVNKGAARPLGEPSKRTTAPEPRVGITIRLPVAVHEQLRVLAFEQRSSKQALIEAWVAERLAPVNSLSG
jgi:hypothetical protein